LSKILIYSPSDSSKLNYVLKFFFQEQLSLEYQVLDNIEAFKKDPSQLKLNYSHSLIPNSIWIKNSEYFSNFNISVTPDIESSVRIAEGRTCAFDLFAAVFFLLVRVEEYRDTTRDEHDRYRSQYSILVQKDLIKLPLIDMWLSELRLEIENRLGAPLSERKYKFTSTIDVDHIYAYKGKSVGVVVGSMLRDLMTFRWRRLRDRFSMPDPYDKLSEMQAWNKSHGIDPLYFVLTTERGKYDKSLPPSSRFFQEQVQYLNTESTVGIHPSYQSYMKPNKVKAEIASLNKILDTDLKQSRQHFLKLSLPDSYRTLIAAGISEDYSMGYPDLLGFRAGTSLPFLWYDLLEDKETTLRVTPFQIMDVTMKNYLGFNPRQAIDSAQEIIASLKAVNGQCCIIWHNSSFYAAEGWEGWEEVYKQILSIAVA